MARLDIERQRKLEPLRLNHAKQQIESLGFECKTSKTWIRFYFNGHQVTFYPYSGWHAGKTIQDGRGMKKLLKQIKHTEK